MAHNALGSAAKQKTRQGRCSFVPKNDQIRFGIFCLTKDLLTGDPEPGARSTTYPTSANCFRKSFEAFHSDDFLGSKVEAGQ
jgi:hypothetical protein